MSPALDGASRRIRLLCCSGMLVAFACLAPCIAAQETGAAGAAKSTPEAIELIGKQAYGLTQTAKTETDYRKVIDLCERGIAAGASQKLEVYGKELIAWAQNRLGQIKLDAGDIDQALVDFNASIASDPAKWLAYHNRGYVYATQGEFEKALADFNRTIELNPTFVRAFVNRGELYYADGKFAEAIADYTAALKLQPNQPDVHNQRGHAYYRVGKAREAMEDFNRTLQLDARNIEAYVNRGDLASDLGQYAEAARDYRRAVDLAPRQHRPYVSAAWIMATCPDARFRDPTLAVTAARRALDLLGEDEAEFRHRYLDVMAAALANAGEFAEAAKTEGEAIAIAPEAVKADYEARLKLYEEKKPYRHAAAARPAPR